MKANSSFTIAFIIIALQIVLVGIALVARANTGIAARLFPKTTESTRMNISDNKTTIIVVPKNPSK